MMDMQWLYIMVILLIPYRVAHNRLKRTYIIEASTWKLELNKKQLLFELKIIRVFHTIWNLFIETKAEERLKKK